VFDGYAFRVSSLYFLGVSGIGATRITRRISSASQTVRLTDNKIRACGKIPPCGNAATPDGEVLDKSPAVAYALATPLEIS
jgi:hypothetical protein